MRRPRRGRGRLHLLAAGAYLAIVLFVLRAVLPAPSELLPTPAALLARQAVRLAELDRRDQAMVVATVTRNAHLLTHAPAALLDGGQCHPMPRSHTLGEHMFGVGLLAALPYAWTGDPIASFNAALGLGWWITALAMYAFVFHYTSHPGAAFVGGLAFLLTPARFVNATHPYGHADLWTPLILLFLHRVFTTRRRRDALALGGLASLQIAESLYPLLVCTLYVLPFAVHLALRHRAAPGVLARRLGLAALPVLATAAIVLGPYLETRATWGLLSDRATFFLDPAELSPGRIYFIGWAVAGLSIVGLFDRFRHPLPDDPRLPLLIGAALVAWGALGVLPLFGAALPSPLLLLRGIVPGLDAVRAMRATISGVHVGLAALTGFGVWALTRQRSWRVRLAVTGLAAVAIWAPASYGPLSRGSFGTLVRLDAYEARPPEDDIALLRSAARGALLDLPYPHEDTPYKSLGAGPMLLLASYSPRATATCYNSFGAATSDEIARHAAALPAVDAARALAALGFGTVLLHEERVPEEIREETRARFAAADALEWVGETSRLALFHLPPPPPLDGDLASLGPAAAAEPVRVTAPHAKLRWSVRNDSKVFFRHPDPIEPTELELHWRSRDGGTTAVTQVRALLPLALAPGAVAPIDIEVATPVRPGAYRAELRLPARHDAPLAAIEVEIAS